MKKFFIKFKDKLIDVIKSLGIGVAILIPGVSAGTIALITKIYDKMTYSIANIFKEFKKSIITLIPIAIGVAIAMLAAWKPLHLASEHILFAMVSLFAGCVIGSLPDVADNIKGETIKKRYYLYLIVAILCGAAFGVLSAFSDKLGINVKSLFNPIGAKLYLIIIPVGFIAATGIVVPGISGSMILLVLGFYTQILGIFKGGANLGPAIGVLACMAIGVLLGMLVFSKIMRILLSKFRVATFIWIIGLVVGGIFSLYYNHDIVAYYNKAGGIVWWEYMLAAFLLIGGFAGSYALTLYNRKHKIAEEKKDKKKDAHRQVSK